jgi:hypothetical protein
MYHQFEQYVRGIDCLGIASALTFSFLCALGSNSSGGGVYVERYGNLNLIMSNLTDNTAGDAGGGLYMDTSAKVSISDSTLRINYAKGQGSGVYAGRDGVLKINNSLFEANGGLGPDDIGMSEAGGAIAGVYAQINITAGRFYNNSAVTGSRAQHS